MQSDGYSRVGVIVARVPQQGAHMDTEPGGVPSHDKITKSPYIPSPLIIPQ